MLPRDIHVRLRTMAGLAFVYTIRDDAGTPVRVLNVGGAYQSATYLGERRAEPVFAYYRGFDCMFEAEGRLVGHGVSAGCSSFAVVDGKASGNPSCASSFSVRRVLVIGGGGCSYPRHLVASRPRVGVDVVEVDPAIADLARRYFFVSELEEGLRRAGESERFRLIVADGLGYLRQCGAMYDVIVNDAFSGKSAAGDFFSADGLAAVRRCLAPGGLYLVNVVVRLSKAGFGRLLSLTDELRKAFASVAVIPTSDEMFGGAENYLVVATDGDYAFSGSIPCDGLAFEPIFELK